MNSYILTAGGRKVTPTARPLMPDDVLYFGGRRYVVGFSRREPDRLVWVLA